MKQTKQTPWRWPLSRLPLLAAFLVLMPAGAHAHFCVDVTGASCQPFSHNKVGHLANTAYSNCVATFGRAACDAARDTANAAADVVEAVGSAVNDVANQGAEGGRTMFESGQQMVSTVGRTVRQGIDCALDLAACAAQVAADAGLSPEQTQQLSQFAVLKGAITMDTALPVQATQLRVQPVNYSENISPACEVLLADWAALSSGAAVVVPVTAGAYSVVVPACDQITYALVPFNPLYTWDPPKRDVTVGPGQASGQVGNNSASGAASSISAPSLVPTGAGTSAQGGVRRN